jgi:hypothetical protein
MDLAARKAALEDVVQQATQRIGQLTERLIGAKAQLALLDELAHEELSPHPALTPHDNGQLVYPPVSSGK